MRKLIGLFVLFAGLVYGDVIDTLRPKGFVNDYANVLSSKARSRTEQRLSQLAEGGGPEIAVVTLVSMAGHDIESVTRTLFDNWGVGKRGKDDGVLLLVSMQERKIRIETGYGVEGSLPDMAAGRIIRDVIGPKLRQGNLDAGIEEGVEALISRLSGELTPVSPGGPISQKVNVFILVLMLGPLWAMGLGRRSWRLPIVAGFFVSLYFWHWFVSGFVVLYGIILGAVVCRLWGASSETSVYAQARKNCGFDINYVGGHAASRAFGGVRGFGGFGGGGGGGGGGGASGGF